MDLLPIEIVCLIIKKLDLNDILSCRLVNKKWSQIVNEHIKISSLAIKDKECQFEEERYLLDREFFKNSYQFNTRNEEFFQSAFIMTVLKNLKHLYIQLPSIYNESDFNLAKNLNNFTKLESLKIDQLTTSAQSATIKLPNLKTLSIDLYDGPTLKLDLPKLEKLVNNCFLKKFEFKNYDTITELTTELYEDCLPKYKNLEKFYCEFLTNDEDYELNNLPKDILSLLPKLKELHCSRLVKKNVIAGVLSSKNKLRRQNFKLFFNGLEIECLNQLETYTTYFEEGYEFLSDAKENFEILLDNFSKLSNFNQYVSDVNYTSICKKFKNGINSEFFKKFVSIRNVVVDKPIENVNHFVNFLKECKILSSLELNNAALDQSFYDNLAIYCPSVSHLKIRDEKPINSDFLLKFNKMFSFSINQNATFDTIEKAFLKFDLLHSFKFTIKKNRSLELFSIENYKSEIRLRRDDQKSSVNDKKYRFVKCFSKSTMLKCLRFVFDNIC